MTAMRTMMTMAAAAVACALLVPAFAAAQDSFGGARKTPQAQQPAQPAQPPAQRPAAPAARPPATSQAPAAQDPAEAQELEDHGVPAQDTLHAGAMHAATPNRIPGGLVITTRALVAMLQEGGSGVLLFDVLGGREALPNALQAAWVSQPGHFNDQVQQQFVQALTAQLQGRTDTPLVFYCESTECWMSYNAALRAIKAGYSQVFWYRGGLMAWKAAGLPIQPTGPR